MITSYAFLGDTNLKLNTQTPEMMTVSFQWDIVNNCPPVNETDLHTYVIGTILTRTKIDELLLINNTFQMIGSPEIYAQSNWQLGEDIFAYTMDQFAVRQTNNNVGDNTGTITFDQNAMMLSSNT